MKFADSFSYTCLETAIMQTRPKQSRVTDLIYSATGSYNKNHWHRAGGFCFCLFHILDGIQLNKTGNMNFCFLMISS